MATTNTSNAELAKKIDALGENLVASNTALNTRLQAMEGQQQKIVEAIYGNGGPGIKETLRTHDATIRSMNDIGGTKVQALDEDVRRLLETHNQCNIMQVAKQLDSITSRHATEDEQHKEAKQTTLDNRKENRKWFLALGLTVATSIAMTLLNLIYEYLHVFK